MARRTFRQHWSDQLVVLPGAAAVAGQWWGDFSVGWRIGACVVTCLGLRPRLVVDDDGFRVTYLVGRARRCAWSEVESVTARVSAPKRETGEGRCVVVHLRHGTGPDRSIDVPWLSTARPWGPGGRSRLQHSLRVAAALRRRAAPDAAATTASEDRDAFDGT